MINLRLCRTTWRRQRGICEGQDDIARHYNSQSCGVITSDSIPKRESVLKATHVNHFDANISFSMQKGCVHSAWHSFQKIIYSWWYKSPILLISEHKVIVILYLHLRMAICNTRITMVFSLRSKLRPFTDVRSTPKDRFSLFCRMI